MGYDDTQDMGYSNLKPESKINVKNLYMFNKCTAIE